jgi:hypothetical protein
VDNTSDANKPVSAAAQTALDLKANLLHQLLQERFLELIKRDGWIIVCSDEQTSFICCKPL